MSPTSKRGIRAAPGTSASADRVAAVARREHSGAWPSDVAVARPEQRQRVGIVRILGERCLEQADGAVWPLMVAPQRLQRDADPGSAAFAERENLHHARIGRVHPSGNVVEGLNFGLAELTDHLALVGGQ